MSAAVCVSPTMAYCSIREAIAVEAIDSLSAAPVAGFGFLAPADLDEGEAQLAQRVAERLLVAAQAVAESLDERAHRVDGELGLLEVRRLSFRRRQVQDRALPQP